MQPIVRLLYKNRAYFRQLSTNGDEIALTHENRPYYFTIIPVRLAARHFLGKPAVIIKAERGYVQTKEAR
jgi:hypothetical protein